MLEVGQADASLAVWLLAKQGGREENGGGGGGNFSTDSTQIKLEMLKEV